MASGIEKAWKILNELPHDEVCRNADVRFDHEVESYVISCLGQDVIVCPTRQIIESSSPVSANLLGKSRYFSELSILWYLVSAKAIPLSGKLIKPEDMPAGQIYTSGSHVLPLDKIALKYGANIPDFLTHGQKLCSENPGLGDASLRLLPFPRIPVVIVLWKECEEFPARADLLFDSSCELQLPLDIAWSTAMLTLLMLM